MKSWKAALTLIISASFVLSACGNEELAPAQSGSETSQPSATASAPASPSNSEDAADKEEGGTEAFVSAVKELVDGMKAGAEAGNVDWAKSQELYNSKIKPSVEARDAEAESQVNQQLEAAAAAGKDGSLEPMVVAQIHDKLLQKVAFLTLRHEFKEANDKFTDKEFVNNELKEARTVYEGILKGMVEKRDTAYHTQLLGVIDSGFAEMEQAAGKGDNLAYNLGKQLVDKSLMKAFYLASGAEKGYGYKIEKAVKEGSKDAKVEQAEGWAFFQSLKNYLEEHDKEAADFIESQFDLANDVKNVKGEPINQAYVRAFAATAKGEYKETFENWGKDKAAITALEGALFISVIESDLPKALGGEAAAKALIDNAQKLLDQVKAGKKAEAEGTYKAVEADLNKLTAFGK
ncbi:hypothetical protein SD71_02070 [Cohnella kolymensis]|uniref:Lipoprotein n=1 Tax=Cohnella kolymensis TaxID=1590652 RepID=A0ABR5A8R5_9BACL|nr:hypothetical protein [Cohnella kolymensis]KIL37451.1 hypothetical protein SD71_02070 [Cohnella kolymensis]